MKKTKLYYIGSIFALCSLVMGIKWCILRKKIYYTNVPVRFGPAGTPLLHVEIEGKEYCVEVDLGSKFQLTLDREIVNQLNKKPCGTVVSHDMKGRRYETLAYRIKSVQIKDLSFSNVKIDEESKDFVRDTIFWMSPHQNSKGFEHRIGTIGRALLKKRNLLLDFPKSLIFITNDLKRLKKEGYELENLEKISLEVGKRGTILLADTDFGKLRLVIDTGSTTSLLRASFLSKNQSTAGKKYDLPFVVTSKFIIGGKDFGPINLCLIDITPELHEFDGILGMDFLKHHIVYLDYVKKIAYIGKSV